jgi:hypothetical protein
MATTSSELDVINANLTKKALGTFQPVARILPLRIADRTLSGDLTILYSRIDLYQLSVVLAMPLIEQVLSLKRDSTTSSDI